MSHHDPKMQHFPLAAGLVLALALVAMTSTTTPAQVSDHSNEYELVTPPECMNDKGETVRFLTRQSGKSGPTAGMAARDGEGLPVVFRSNYASSPPEFQSFMDRHECAHHQTGDVDRPHPPRNGPDHLMNESISDCIAILRLRDEENFGETRYTRVTESLRSAMAKIGFPEISISSRIANIENCFREYGAPQDFIDEIRDHRKSEGQNAEPQ